MTRTDTSGKVLWLSIIQGWAILLVVIGHVNAFDYGPGAGTMYPASEWIHRFCYAFHMPLFMFVSGGLLYLTRISRDWSVSALYRDKLRRLLLPYVIFTVIGFLIKIPFGSVTKSGLDISAAGFVSALFDPASGPLKELWFLGTLMWLMLMYPLYRALLHTVWGEMLLLAMTLLPFVLDIHPDFSGWFNLSGVIDFAYYFAGGILFFKYNCVRWFENRLWASIAVTLIFATCFLLQGMPPVITATAGILATFGWASRLERFPGLFASFRDHSFQIYLVGIFPQMLVELLVWKHFHQEWMQLPFYLVSCALALTTGVMVSRMMGKAEPRWIRWCFGLK